MHLKLECLFCICSISLQTGETKVLKGPTLRLVHWLLTNQLVDHHRIWHTIHFVLEQEDVNSFNAFL